LIQFNGGETGCLQRIPVGDLGTHVVQSHAPGMAFVLTALSRTIEDYRRHLVRLINHLELTALHWFNLNHSTIECETLRNGRGMDGKGMISEISIHSPAIHSPAKLSKSKP
jgi:hypothetical protein